jgi:hypothetical protein
MSTAIKVILGVVVSFVLIVIIGVVIAAYWFTTHKDQLLAGAQKTMKEGESYGRTTDNKGCVNEAFERGKRDQSMTGTISNKLFLKGCLDNSRNTPNFCAGVPKQTSFFDSVTWINEQCTKRGATGEQYCTQLFQEVQQFCYK